MSLGARHKVCDHVWKVIVYSSASGFSCRTESPYDVQRSCRCPCSRHRSVCRAVFGLGSYLGARPNVDPQQELAALRAEIDLLRKQQDFAPTRTAGIGPLAPVAEAAVFDSEKRAAIVADVKRQLQTELGLLPLTLIRDRRHSFVELYSYDDTGASNNGTAGYLGNGYFITVKHGVVAFGPGRCL